MDKLKALFKPGHSTDDEQLYGTGNSGTVDGQGSHFGANKTTSSSGMSGEDTLAKTGASTTAPTSTTHTSGTTSSAGYSGSDISPQTDATGIATQQAAGSHTTSNTGVSGTSGSHFSSGVGGTGISGSAIPIRTGEYHDQSAAGAHTTSGPHAIPIANALDPNISGHGVAKESAHKHHGDSDRPETPRGGGAEEADLDHGESTSSSHRAIPASSVGVGAGAGIAAGAYEHHKHDRDLTQGERDAKREHKHELKEERKHHHDDKLAHDQAHHHGDPRHSAIASSLPGAGPNDRTALGHTDFMGHQHENLVAGPAPGRKGVPASDATAPLADTSHANEVGGLSGPAPNTAGPHSKDWMNKLDPRVYSAGPATGSTGSRETTRGHDAAHPMHNRDAYVDDTARANPGFVDSYEHPTGVSAVGTGNASDVVRDPVAAEGHHHHTKAQVAGKTGTPIYDEMHSTELEGGVTKQAGTTSSAGTSALAGL